MNIGMVLLAVFFVTAMWIPLVVIPAGIAWLFASSAHLEYLCNTIAFLSVAVWATTLLCAIDSQKATARLMMGSLSAWLITVITTYIVFGKS